MATAQRRIRVVVGKSRQALRREAMKNRGGSNNHESNRLARRPAQQPGAMHAYGP